MTPVYCPIKDEFRTTDNQSDRSENFAIVDTNTVIAVFTLNFSSAGKGPFVAGKTKNKRQRHNFPGEGR